MLQISTIASVAEMMGFVSLISVINTVTATGTGNELTLHTGESDLARIMQKKCLGLLPIAI